MPTEELRPIRLTDYRPPDWLIESVDLDVSLAPTATRAHAKLKIQTNSARAPASLALDGKPLPAESFIARPDKLTIAQPPHRAFELEIETAVDPTANTRLMGL